MYTSTTVVIACALTAALAGARPNPDVAPDTVHRHGYAITLYSETDYYGFLQPWSGSIATSSDARKCDKCITVDSYEKGDLRSLQFDPKTSWMYVSFFKDTKCHTTPLAVYHGKYYQKDASSTIRNAASFHVCWNPAVAT
ncbi:hypothetical protein BV22DRAFT_1028508 [Leucogyrophana mollusca]|uniref:Uncharacterized protein n=1 Tax=Leucogyrophana mollusca TaxID=85980 RepID=A0ACB8BXR0_9AGAM|nr:hypothetical protein BV22DRAFT_1028508 [Leucogyrophana mollusca]